MSLPFNNRKAQGFTLIELLVVMAIIGVLAGLLLPAVQKVRESAARTTCSNKMKQIAFAMQNHHDSLGAFPSGQFIRGITDSGCINLKPDGTNIQLADVGKPWSVALLPFLDQATMLTKFDSSQMFSVNREFIPMATANGPGQVIPMPAFRCPSDPKPMEIATSNYLAVAGGGPPPPSIINGEACVSITNPNFVLYYNGITYMNSKTKIGDIRDGASNTYLVAESKYQVADLFDDGRDKRGLWSGGGYPTADFRYYISMTAAIEPINQPCCGIRDYTPGSLRQWEMLTGRTFGSFHTLGCNVAFADGSVHYMLNTTNLDVHRLLGSMKDGNPLGVAP